MGNLCIEDGTGAGLKPVCQEGTGTCVEGTRAILDRFGGEGTCFMWNLFGEDGTSMCGTSLVGKEP